LVENDYKWFFNYTCLHIFSFATPNAALSILLFTWKMDNGKWKMGKMENYCPSVADSLPPSG